MKEKPKMATYNKKIKVQKLNADTEAWEDYYSPHAKINKATGKEYYNASTDISASTFNFSIRYCQKLDDIQYNTTSYRILYKNRIFDIKNVDNKNQKDHELVIVGDYSNVSKS